MTETTTLCVALLAGVAALLIIVGVASRHARARRAALRERFGPEYQRALELYGNPMRADRELAARAKRVTRFHLRELDNATRARFATAWAAIQVHFVDDPTQAVREANGLIKDVMVAIGYPADEFDQRVADLSVHHPNVVQHYRAAHALAQSNRNGEGDTEELRQAVVHYRALFSELVEKQPVLAEGTLRELHA